MTVDASMALLGLPVRAESYLVGSKIAFLSEDGILIVSPAMYDLISHAEGPELERLLASIPVKRAPALRGLLTADL